MSNLTVEDTESSFLNGKAVFEEWLRQFEMQWYMPQIIDYLGMLVNTTPIEKKLSSPMEAAMLEKTYRGMRGG